MAIYCCYGCVAPKRQPGCHSRCTDYINEKAIHDEQKAAENKRNAIVGGIIQQKTNGVYRANKTNKPKRSGWKRRR